MFRLDQDRQRPDFKPLAMQTSERLDDRCHEVRAAAHRFGQDHVGLTIGPQLVHDLGQVVELAAKAGAGHLAHLESPRPQGSGIDQVVRLVVGHQADVQAAVQVALSCPRQGGRFPGSQKPPHH